MFRNQYDNDVTVWSPQGRLHQVEYAMEAVKQGSPTVGLKNKTHAVLVALKRASSELSAHQKKIIPIDSHVGVSIAGLTADARLLSKFMRVECLNSRYTQDTPLPINRLVALLGNKMQVCTQRYDRRPYGVGLLVAGYDDLGPHIYQTCPSANYFDCKAMAIGSRSQSARTYLEKHLDNLKECGCSCWHWMLQSSVLIYEAFREGNQGNLEELVKHGLRALRECLPNEIVLSNKNVSIAIVGKGMDFTVYEDDGVGPYLAGIAGEERTRHRHQSATDTVGDATAQDQDKDAQPTEPSDDVAMDESMSVD